MKKKKFKYIRDDFLLAEGESFCRIGEFDLINPIDAYALKPHIGYCP